MTIERMDKNLVVFDDITPGTVFEYYNVVYMKTRKFTKSAINAVKLDDGWGASFSGYEEIIPLDAKLVVK